MTASESNRILAVDSLCLNSKDYYNLAVSQGSRSKAELLDGLLTAFEMENFHVRSTYGSLLNKAGEKTAHVLQHIFFCSSDQIYLARRFASRCMIQMDATFNTNNLNLPLSVIVGVTNTDMTFPIGFAFIQSESTEAFQHILKSMDDLIWSNCPRLNIILADQAKGLKPAANALWPDVTIQLCEWHASQNFIKRFNNSGRYSAKLRQELKGLV